MGCKWWASATLELSWHISLGWNPTVNMITLSFVSFLLVFVPWEMFLEKSAKRRWKIICVEVFSPALSYRLPEWLERHSNSYHKGPNDSPCLMLPLYFPLISVAGIFLDKTQPKSLLTAQQCKITMMKSSKWDGIFLPSFSQIKAFTCVSKVMENLSQDRKQPSVGKTCCSYSDNHFFPLAGLLGVNKSYLSVYPVYPSFQGVPSFLGGSWDFSDCPMTSNSGSGWYKIWG